MVDESLDIGNERIEQEPLLPQEQAFTESLERLGRLPMVELPRFSDRLSHIGDMATPDPDHALASGIYVRSGAFGTVPESASAVVAYAPQPLADVGRKTERAAGGAAETHHGTFFGALNLSGDNGESTPVAIKPLSHNSYASVDHATQELAMLEYTAASGLPTLDVLGIVVDNEAAIPTTYIITRRDPEIRSLDTLDWSREAAHADEHLATAITTLAALHSQLIFHRDLEFKNVSSRDDQGSIVVYDLEWAISLRDAIGQGAEPDVERLSRAVEFDLGTVQRSMRNILYPHLPDSERPVTTEARFEYERQHLYEPYCQAILSAPSKYRDVLEAAYQKALERQQSKSQV